MVGHLILFTPQLRPQLPTIVGNVDYSTLRLRLQQIDELLRTSGVERDFMERALVKWLAGDSGAPTAREQEKFQMRSRRALRCNLLRTLLQEEYRPFSCALAGNPLYQWFCLIDAVDQVRVPSKSELQRYAHLLDASQMRLVIEGLLSAGIQDAPALNLQQPVDLNDYFLDTTCLKANVHFPVDWVLLRDGIRTLMKAVKLIRRQGLKGRMEAPEDFLRRINRLCIQMTHSRRKVDGKKQRKQVLRGMKKTAKVVAEHARRHRELLDQQWEKTAWTRAQAEQIIKRIDGVLDLLPRAAKQAHERIIGGRLVDNSEKILSLYEPDIHVLVRGKAGANVEFGNTLLVGENRQGIILDYQIWKEQAPGDGKILVGSVGRVMLGTRVVVSAVGADRGFASKANAKQLEEAGIFNGICPKSPQELKERMKEPQFAEMQKRRSQTEARISILQRGFLGRPMRAKGFDNRELAVAWGVLTHNMWMFGRLRKLGKEEALQKAA